MVTLHTKKTNDVILPQSDYRLLIVVDLKQLCFSYWKILSNKIDSKIQN